MIKTSPRVRWINDLASPTEYTCAIKKMESIVGSILSDTGPETVWLVQHPPLYSAGTSACEKDLLEKNRFPVFRTGRGGQFTYHGPGQIVGYTILDLNKRNQDVRKFVFDLESWIIRTLQRLGVRGERREGKIGIWVVTGKNKQGLSEEKKIAAIGIRVRRWVSYHGIAINVETNLSHFDGIVPCGISESGVTSLRDLGVTATIEDVAHFMRESFEDTFQRKTLI
jgi:lipoyl(octanoyl) transferase